MFKLIKSTYIIEEIFSYLLKKKKFEIFAYNKEMQKICKINTIDYKINADNYAIKDNDENYIIKSLENDFIVYEGGYSKRKKNGFGKKYNLVEIELNEYIKQNKDFSKELKKISKEKIIGNENNKNVFFIEESKRGIITKNGLKYYCYIVLEFEGEYLNGERNGKGKEYNNEGKLLFEGEYKEGKRWNGKGEEIDIDDSNIKFEGEYLNGEKFRGKEFYNDGNLKFLAYEGEYNENGERWNGRGKIIDDNKIITFDGEYINGSEFGILKLYDDFKGYLKFEGEYKNGAKNGKGKQFDEKGNIIFEGEYLDGERWNGHGKEFDDLGNIIFEGEYKNGIKKSGIGKNYENNYLIFELEFNIEEGKEEGKGKGKEYDNLGNIIFEGEYINVKMKTVENDSDSNSNSEESNVDFIYGERWNGIETIYDQNGDLIYEVEYRNGIKYKNEIKEKLSNRKNLKRTRKIYDNKNNLLFEIDYDNNLLSEEKEKLLKINSSHVGNDGLIIDTGKEIDLKNNSIFEGEFLNGKKLNGIIKIYYESELDNNKIIPRKNLKDYINNAINNFKSLKFEGDFKNGEINGSGKEYNIQGNLEFEGEYLKGERNGKGKEYSIYGNLIYEGEYLKGKMNGKGRKYDLDGNLEFEGEYMDGQRWNGKEISKIEDGKNTRILETEYKNGKEKERKIDLNEKGKKIREIENIELIQSSYVGTGDKDTVEDVFLGKGKEYNSKGDIIFEGEYLNEKRNGKGIEYDDNKKIIFQGEYINDKKWEGTEYNRKGIYVFEQKYEKGEKTGKIIMKEYFKNNLRFEGELLNGKRNGKGKEYYKNKLIFEGEYLLGKRNGKGIEYNFEGGKFIGEFKNGIKWDGIGYDKNNKIDYQIRDGTGIVKEFYEGNLIYEGNCLNGKRHGEGIEYDFLTGKIKYNGRFVYGKKFE